MFANGFSAEAQQDGTILFKQFASGSVMTNWGITNIAASKTGVSIFVSGSYIV